LIDAISFQGFEIGSKLWLSSWANSNASADSEGLTSADYITMYGLFGLFQSVAFLAAVLLVSFF
jgi:hypothetical protein